MGGISDLAYVTYISIQDFCWDGLNPLYCGRCILIRCLNVSQAPDVDKYLPPNSAARQLNRANKTLGLAVRLPRWLQQIARHLQAVVHDQLSDVADQSRQDPRILRQDGPLPQSLGRFPGWITPQGCPPPLLQPPGAHILPISKQ